MSSETSVNIRFNVNASQLKKMFQNLTRLSTKIKLISKDMTKLGGSLKRLDSKFSSASNKSRKFTKALKSQESKQKRAAASLQRLTKNTNKYTKATKRTGKGSQTAAGGISLLGFRMLALGSTASFAGDMLKRFFIDIVKEGVEDLGAMNRAIVQSGINLENFLGGNLREFDIVSDRIKDLQQIFGEFTRADVGSAFEQIGRAFPSSTSLDDIEEVTENLLKMARIDKTEGAGLPKTAVDLRRVMVQFSIGAKDLDAFLDKLVNVNQQGAIELNQLVSSLGFAGAQMQRFGLDINESLALTGFFFEKGGRKAGAAGRTFGNVINKLASLTTALNPNIRNMGIEIVNTAGEYNSFTDIINQSRKAFAKMKAEGKGQIFETALLEEFGFSAIEIRGFLSLMQATEEELKELIAGVEKVGTADLLSDALGEGASVQLKTFENELRNLKTEFASGLIPTFKTFTAAVRLFSQDKEFVNVLEQFGKTMGDTLVKGLNLVIPPLEFFSNLLKNNASLVRFLATATTALVGALIAMGIIFLVAGSIAMLISVYQKLMEKSKLLRAVTMVLSKTFGKLLIAVKRAAIGMATAFRGVGQKIVGGITSGLKFLIPKFIAAGARAGLFFGAAFNILANAFIGAGRWIISLVARLTTTFTAAGAVTGGAFGSAFTAASRAIMAAGAWITTMIAVLAIKLGLGGAVTGVAFGSGFTVSAGTTMRSGAWVSRVIASISVKFVAFGAAIGAAFGAVWTTAARLMMIASGWLTTIFAKIGLSSAIGGAAAGTKFGLSFVGGALLAIASALTAAAILDVLTEQLFGQSIIKEIARRLGLDIPSPGEAVGIPPPKVPFFDPLDRTRNGVKVGGGNKFFDDVAKAFQPLVDFLTGGVPEDFGKEMDAYVEAQGAQNLLIPITNVSMVQANTLMRKDNELIKVHTATTDFLTKQVNTQIIEVIRNINIISSLTTMIAAAQLMFANLTAQGNRAARKLASLRVSDKGKFSISDSGISGIDQGFISRARGALAIARANQVVIDQNIEILINPVITVENGGTESAEQVANTITDELDTVLRKRIGAIVSA